MAGGRTPRAPAGGWQGEGPERANLGRPTALLTMRLLLLAACFLATSAGGAAQTAAPVTADPADLAAFVGEWAGGYVGEDSGRQGTVVFRLAATGDSVRALVLMVPRPTADDPMPAPVPLAVHHVTVEDRTVRGTLVRYDDPEWGLPLETEFRGILSDDGRLEGWFRSVGTRIDTIPEVGHWWALRAADAPLAL